MPACYHTAMAKESSIVASIVREANTLGWWTMKIHGGPYQLSGVPDLLCIRKGVAVFLEVKQPGKQPTKIQRERMNEIEKKAGSVCAVVTSTKEAKAVLLEKSVQPITMSEYILSNKVERRKVIH